MSNQHNTTTPRRHQDRRSPNTRPSPRAFTLVELLVVIVIIAAASVLILPGVASVVRSNNYAASVNLVSTSLSNARARALSTDNTAGLLFLFDAEREVYTLQVIELSSRNASLTNRPRSSQVRQRDTYTRAFIPAIGVPAVELPQGIAVYGLSYSIAPNDPDPLTGVPILGDEIDDGTAAWYAGERVSDVSISGLPDAEEVPWIFPRNDPLLTLEDRTNYLTDPDTPDRDELWDLDDSNADAIRAVRHSMSFAIFFDRSGKVVSTDGERDVPTPNAFLELPTDPIDRTENDPELREELDQPLVFDPERGLGQDITPNPEVMIRSAQQLAVVDLRALRQGVGPVIRTNDPWLYRSETDNDDFVDIEVPGERSNGGLMIEDDEAVRAISAWIDNNAEIISFNQYTGSVIKRSSQ